MIKVSFFFNLNNNYNILFLFTFLFAFSSTLNHIGCNVPCGDHDGYVCGCSDGACGGLSVVKGEEHIRRWVVYSVGKKPDPAPEDENDGGSYDGDDVPDDSEGEGGTKKEEKKTKKKRKKGNKKTRKSSDEL
jgi:hypothetical protein